MIIVKQNINATMLAYMIIWLFNFEPNLKIKCISASIKCLMIGIFLKEF